MDQDANVAAGGLRPTSPRSTAPDEDQLLPQLVAHLREHRTNLRQDWASRIQGSGLLHAMTPAGDGRRDHVGLRQLRRGARDRQRRGPAALRPRPVRADHPARGGDPRGRRHRAAAARRAGPVPVREVPARLRAAEPGAGRLRAGGQPDRQHRRRQLRRRARARHPAAAGLHPRAVDAGPAGPRTAADPADHRRPRQRARPAADRAAAQRHPHAPREGRRHRHHRRPGRGRVGRQPPGPHGGRLPAHGRERHHHRACPR